MQWAQSVQHVNYGVLSRTRWAVEKRSPASQTSSRPFLQLLRPDQMPSWAVVPLLVRSITVWALDLVPCYLRNVSVTINYDLVNNSVWDYFKDLMSAVRKALFSSAGAQTASWHESYCTFSPSGLMTLSFSEKIIQEPQSLSFCKIS